MKKTAATLLPALLVGTFSLTLLSSAPANAMPCSGDSTVCTGESYTGYPGGVKPAGDTYPAPVVTPNTVDGTPPASAQATESAAPSKVAEPALASTGLDQMTLIWAAVGLLALLTGIISVISARRNA